jgi:LAO/AO transport system kinase
LSTDLKNIKASLSEAQKGDSAAFARLLTLIERVGPRALAVPELLNPQGAAFRVGITGPPGSGKSTLIGQILTELSRKKLKIGVLAVDPSSPISKGAILGDRIRYSDHFLDENIFIRSLGTRGSLGGLSSSAYLMLRAFDACGFDIVLIETVGVGQVEVEIMHVADLVTLVLVPESGDSIQIMKAGILEIADLYVVNKSDRPGAAGLMAELEVSLDGNANKQIMMTTAIEGAGVSALVSEILSAQKKMDLVKSRASIGRLKEEAKALLRSEIEAEVYARIDKIKNAQDFKAVVTVSL